MITDSVSFDVTGLVPQPAPPPERRWATARGLTVTLTVGAMIPVFPATAAGEAAMRTHYRQRIAEMGAGLVELTYARVDGCQAVRTIIKVVMDPISGWGRTFLGGLEIATAGSCLVVRVECSEARNAWVVDPQDPTPRHLACNVSDDRKYDTVFPDHPLSLVRAFLDLTQSSMKIGPGAAGAPATKRWWKIR